MQEAELPATDRVRSVFDEVLAGPDFRYAEGSPLARWIDALTDLAADLLRRWWPDLSDSQVRVIAWVGLAAVTLTLVLMLVRWASRGQGRAPRPAEAGTSLPPPRDAAGWARRARAAAAAGRYREAATGLYQATILHLDAAGAVRYREWKTPGDYALEASGQGPLRGGLVEFLSGFVELAFGPKEPSAAAFEALSARAARLGSPV